MARARHGVLLPLLALMSVALSSVFVFDLWHTTTLPSGCDMTYSWPVYTPLAWSKATQHTKYALYSVHMHEQRETLTGVPVLFLPGHLGSYKQARSLARHLFDLDATLFDVFALDFHDEPTALSGDFAMQQAQYVNAAIRTILRQYKKQQLSALKRKSKAKRIAKPSAPHTPDSVLIVAHSMGGIVARLAETLPSYAPKSIQHVVSLGSPHDRASFPFDAAMHRVYAAITAAAPDVSAASTNASLADAMDDDAAAVVYISLSGGHKDTHVHASFSTTDRIIAHPERTLAMLTTAMPHVHLTVDHVCLLWCHQLLARVAQSIVAVVDAETHMLVPLATQRLAAARTVLFGTGDDSDAVDAAVVDHHKALVRDGYAPDEYAQYSLWTPRVLFQLLRARYATLFVVLYALALHLLSRAIAHWQRAFELASSSDTAAAAAATAAHKVPSFTSLLHPLAHIPLVAGNSNDADAAPRSTAVVAAAGAVAIGAAAFAVEMTRQHADAAAPFTAVLELAVLYAYALGLLFVAATALSVVRAVVAARVAAALAARTKNVPRWLIIAAVYALVLALGHVESVAPLRFATSLAPARTLALLVLATFGVLVMYVVALGSTESAPIDQQRLQRSLFAVFALSLVPCVGKLLAFADVVQTPPSVVSQSLLLESCAWIAALTLARVVATRSLDAMVPMPPSAFFGAATGHDAAALYDRDQNRAVGVNGSRTSTSTSSAPITAETCPDCVFEDGGPGAILVEYTNKETQRLRWHNDVVYVGPTFRVVACDCVVRFADQPRAFCGFCTRSCHRCGGGAGNVMQATRYRDFVVETQNARAMHATVPLLLEVFAVAALACGLTAREHVALYCTLGCVAVLFVYDVALLTNVEAKRRKNKRNKASKKKKRKSKTKTKAKASSSSGSGSTTTTPPVTVHVTAPTAPRTNSTCSSNSTAKASSKTKTKKQAGRPPNPNVPESLFVNPIYEMVDDE